MAENMSDFLENAVYNSVLRGVAFPSIPTPYVGLHVANPGEAGGSELTGGSYVRQSAVFSAPSPAGQGSNTNTITWTGLPAASVTHFAIYDAASGGNMLLHAPLIEARTFTLGDRYDITPGLIVVNFK